MSAVRPIVAGNWKMNGLKVALAEINALAMALKRQSPAGEIVICPPATLLAPMAQLDCAPVQLGGQDCHWGQAGAHTGDISAEMLADAGAAYLIVGHSERRADHGETDQAVCAKVQAAVRGGLVPIVCVGETLEQRQQGQALAVVASQLRGSIPAGLESRFAVAYEPVWAIGTGLTPTTAQIAQVHAEIRKVLVEICPQSGAGVAILYGGSVKPNNAAEILSTPQVGGALVGGASLKAQDFLAIVRALP